MKKFLLLILLLEVFLMGVFLASSMMAQATTHQTTTTVELVNPLASLGVQRPGDLVLRAFQGFASIMAAFTIAFTVFNGFKLVIAGGFAPGKDQKRNEAKEGLIWSVGGFIVSLLAFTIIAGAAKFIGFEPSLVDLTQDTIPSTGFLKGPKEPGDFISVMNFVMVNFLGLVGFATTLMIIYYGYRYMTAAGNEEAITAAKTGLKWAILGLIVVLLAFTIITAIRQYLVFGLPK